MLRSTTSALLTLLVATAAADNAKEPKPGAMVELAIAPGKTMVFCWVPAGEAQLGSPAAEREEALKYVKADAERLRLATETEELRGKYKTTGFWMGKYAVTQAEWTAVMGKNPSYFVPGKAELEKAGITATSRFPVENVSWHDCQEFVKKLNDGRRGAAAKPAGKFVVPDEDQWEYACRGGLGNGRAYYFGTAHNGTLANSQGEHPFGIETKGSFLGRPADVGSYERQAPHPWGLCDMHGNMWQWCANKYSSANEHRVVRGGTFSSGCRGARSACRTGRDPAERSKYYGIRLVFLGE
jgi:formylglycine-generating enzyme required for sulfatase activity